MFSPQFPALTGTSTTWKTATLTSGWKSMLAKKASTPSEKPCVLSLPLRYRPDAVLYPIAMYQKDTTTATTSKMKTTSSGKTWSSAMPKLFAVS